MPKLPEREFKELEDAAFEYCLSRKSDKLSAEKWFPMQTAKLIRKAFRAGAEWQRYRKKRTEEDSRG